MKNYKITEFLNWCQDNTRYTRNEAAIALRDLYIIRHDRTGHLFFHEECDNVHYKEFAFVDIIVEYINSEMFEGELIIDGYSIEDNLRYLASNILDDSIKNNKYENVDLDALENLINFRRRINYNCDIVWNDGYSPLGQIISIEELIRNNFDDFTQYNTSSFANMNATEFELYMNTSDEWVDKLIRHYKDTNVHIYRHIKYVHIYGSRHCKDIGKTLKMTLKKTLKMTLKKTLKKTLKMTLKKTLKMKLISHCFHIA